MLGLKKELDFEYSGVNVKKSEALEESMAVTKRRLDEKDILEDHKLDVKSESVLEEKPYPKMSLHWTNVICDELTEGTTTSKPYHILLKPNKILCGGISVIGNHQTFTGLHRKECCNNANPCCDWPDSHDANNLFEYSKEHKILRIRLDSFVWDRNGDTITFDWSLFCSEAAEFCFEKGLKKLLKIFES